MDATSKHLRSTTELTLVAKVKPGFVEIVFIEAPREHLQDSRMTRRLDGYDLKQCSALSLDEDPP